MNLKLNRNQLDSVHNILKRKTENPEPDNTEQNLNDWFNSLYDWQAEKFIGATKDYSEVCLCAANQVGKTRTGSGVDACHLTGFYPDGWDGHTFNHAPLIWCLGYSGEKTRDLIQAKLFGQFIEKRFQGGLIHASQIIDWQSMTGTPGAMRTVRVRHKQGISTVQFWSYSQGQHAIMGDSIDWFHVDEEPKDQSIYPQVITRTTTGDNGCGGRGILTFTPENGRTSLVIKFMDDPGSGQKFIRKGWDDAPHLDDQVKQRLLESYPEHQRDMRTKGVPMLGHGRIYDMSEEFITCDPFDIPDHWLVIGAVDFGYDHPQAISKLAIDIDNDIIYLTNGWKAPKVSANDAWGSTHHFMRDIPTAWPQDGLQHEKGRDDSRQQMELYKEAGFSMLHDFATWDGSSRSVEQGIHELRQRMQTGRFKVFRGIRCFFDEFKQYHRAPKTVHGITVTSEIVKVMDDVLDSTRYAYMMRRFAKAKGEISNPAPQYIPKPLKPIGRK